MRIRSFLDRWQITVFVSLVLLSVGLTATYLAVQPAYVPPVHASACKDPNGVCVPGYRNAAADVMHYALDGDAWVIPVEPETGESWSIAAYWNTAQPEPCYQMSETATVDVDWTAGAWSLSNVSTTAHILAIDLCDNGGTCGTQVNPHGYGFKLRAKVSDPVVSASTYNLRVVTFATTSVDSGNEVLGSPCTFRNAVAPMTQLFTQDDSGFECGYSCDYSGPSIVLKYQ